MNIAEIVDFLKENDLDYNKYSKQVNDLYEYLEKNNYKFIPGLEMPFWNHIVNLIIRVEENEQSQEEILSEDDISPEAKKISEEIFELLGLKQVSETEKFLMMIYSQNLL